MKKLDRKAWIRIVEAFLAILIIIGAVLIIISRQEPKIDISQDVYEKQRQILDVISKNNSLREKIIIGENLEVNNIILKLAPGSWNFAINICELDKICSNPVESTEIYEKNVYVTEVIVTSNLTKYSPKKLRFFVWVK